MHVIHENQPILVDKTLKIKNIIYNKIIVFLKLVCYYIFEDWINPLIHYLFKG